MAFTNLCRLEEVPKGLTATFFYGEHELLLLRAEDGELKAYESRCPHQLVSLSGALFDGRTLTCQLHRWTFDAKTGQSRPPHSFPLTRYPVQVTDGIVQVDVTTRI